MSLQALFSPRSVAVIGISLRDSSFQVGGRAVVEHLRRHGYPGSLHPVTRNGQAITNFATVARIADLPLIPDCLVVAVRTCCFLKCELPSLLA